MSRAAHIFLAALFLASLAFGLDNPYLQMPPWAALFAWSSYALFKQRRGERPVARLFLLALTAYLATFRWHGGDDIPNSLLPFSLLRYGTLSMEPFRDYFAQKGLTGDFTVEARGHLLSVHPLGPGILALPVFAVSVLCGNLPGEQLLHNLAKISGSLICALAAVTVFLAARTRSSPAWAARVAALYAFGTYAFSVASQALWSHGPAMLGTALALWGCLEPADLPARALLSGFGIGLATACRPDSFLFLAAISLYWLVHRRKTLLPYALGACLPLGLTVAYWLYYVGAPRPPESHFQGNMFGAFQWPALWAMLLSPTRGLVFFTPAALLGFWGMSRAWRGGRTAAVPYLAAALLATYVFFCFRTTWSAGQTFGNRYFAVVTLVPVLFCAFLEEPVRRSPLVRAVWAAVFSVSVLIHATGAFFTWPGSYALEEQLASLWDARLFPPVNLLSAHGALGSLPFPARAAVLGAFLALTAALGRRIYASGPKA